MKKDRLERAYSFFCISAPLSSLAIASGTLIGLEVGTVMLLSGASVLVSPFILKGIDAVKEKNAYNRIKGNNYFLQSFDNMFRRNNEEEELSFETSDFNKYISNKLKETLVPRSLILEEETRENINQFLYLINSNYYYSIKESNPNLKREKLVDRVLSQIINYLERNNITNFDHKIAKKVLEKCDFISPNLKKEIIKEFKDGKISYMGKDVYSVNIRSCELGKSKKKFDINSNSDYDLIIDYVAQMKNFKSANLRSLQWDIESLKNIVLNIRNNYMSFTNCRNDLELMNSFITSVARYAIKNKCNSIGERECIGSIYDCNYISFLSTKNDIVGDLLINDNFNFLDSESDTKNKEKVIGRRPSK